MKNPRILPLFCYLICLFVLCFLACGGREDVQSGATNPLNPTDTSTDSIEELDPFILRVESIYAQLNEGKVDVPRNWEKVKDPVLRAAYARFLLSKGKLAIPRHWIHTEDRVLHAEYYRAQLLKPVWRHSAGSHCRKLGIKRCDSINDGNPLVHAETWGAYCLS